MILATSGPPLTFWIPTLLIPYSTAWRTRSLLIMWPEFGLWRLNAMYGTVLIHGQILNFGSWVDRRFGYALGWMVTSIGMSYLPACRSASRVAASGRPMRTGIWLAE